MIEINTERLTIFPLTEKELVSSVNNFEYVERAKGLRSSKIAISDKRKMVFKIRLEKVKHNKENYMWNTVWLITLTKEKLIIGSIMIKGCPNENGEVILGYSMEEDYRCKGYMTETLESIVIWIFKNDDTKYIIADTLKDNIPSHKVLQNIGMIKYREDNECFWWRLKREESDVNIKR